jgi:hypothetical protein
MAVVEEAVQILFESKEGAELTGCALDFAVMQRLINGEETRETCLVEVNDGYSLGRYEGLSGKDYTDLLVARWAQLVKHLR